MKYCSLLCFHKHVTLNTRHHICKQCNKSFTAKRQHKSKSGFRFCCQRCFGVYNSSHKTTGNRRSKLENWIEQQLKVLFPSLEICYNKVDAINSELDIYIPSLKLAFELNGVFHYEPIFGNEQLEKRKNNDKRKIQACLEKQIELCVIDTHNVKYLKKERDKKFLDIIINLINSKFTSPLTQETETRA